MIKFLKWIICNNFISDTGTSFKAAGRLHFGESTYDLNCSFQGWRECRWMRAHLLLYSLLKVWAVPLLMSKGLKEAQLDAGGAEVIRQSAQRGGRQIQRTPPKTPIKDESSCGSALCCFLLITTVFCFSPVKHADLQKQREEVEWETNEKRAAQRPNYGSNDARREARPVRFTGADCSAGWEVCCAPSSVRPERNITWPAALPSGDRNRHPRTSQPGNWRLETVQICRAYSAPPFQNSRPLTFSWRSSRSLRLSDQLGKTLAHGLPPLNLPVFSLHAESAVSIVRSAAGKGNAASVRNY